MGDGIATAAEGGGTLLKKWGAPLAGLAAGFAAGKFISGPIVNALKTNFGDMISKVSANTTQISYAIVALVFGIIAIAVWRMAKDGWIMHAVAGFMGGVAIKAGMDAASGYSGTT
jgi:hypothetical protein